MLVPLALMFVAGGAEVVDSRPSIAFLRVARAPEATALEEELAVELALLMERFRVVPVAGPDELLEGGVAEQVEAVDALGRSEGAIAVVWVAGAGRASTLHLYVPESGRLYTRRVGRGGRREVKQAAMTAREMLGSAYLFEPPASPDPGITDLVEQVEQQIAAPPASWGVLASVAGSGGVVGQKASASGAGGSVAVEARLVSRLTVQPGVDVRVRAPNTVPGGRVDAWSLIPRAALWLLVPLDGPVVGAGLTVGYSRTQTTFRLGTGPAYSRVHQQAILGLALGGRVYTGDSVGLVATLGGEWATPQYQITRRSDHSTAWRTPWLSWTLNLGVVLRPEASY